MSKVGPKKYQKIARMYDGTGLSMKCTLIKTILKTSVSGTEAKFRPFVDALILLIDGEVCSPLGSSCKRLVVFLLEAY